MNWLRWVGRGLLALALLAMIIPSQVLHIPLPFATLQSGSMTPNLNIGDIAIVLPILAPVRPGQVIVFKTAEDSLWKIHRIVRGDAASGFITQGDHNAEPDQSFPGYPAVRPADIAGFVPEVAGQGLKIPFLGQMFLTLRAYFPGQRVSFLLIVLAAALLLYGNQSRGKAGGRANEQMMISIFGLLACGLVAAVLATGMAASSQKVRLDFTSGQAQVNPSGSQARSAPISTSVRNLEPYTINNAGLVPLTMYVISDRDYLQIDTTRFVLLPGQKHAIQIAVDAQALPAPADQATLTIAGFLPFVPYGLTSRLLPLNLSLAILASALVPVSPVVVWLCWRILVGSKRRRLITRLERLRYAQGAGL